MLVFNTEHLVIQSNCDAGTRSCVSGGELSTSSLSQFLRKVEVAPRDSRGFMEPEKRDRVVAD
jgi:hypothetical protein